MTDTGRITGAMSTQQAPHPGRRVPELTLGWRLQLALAGRHTPEEMAEYLGVHRSTVYRWMKDAGAAPRPAYVRQWAIACSVDVDWLLTGKASDTGPEQGDPTSIWYRPVSSLDARRANATHRRELVAA